MKKVLMISPYFVPRRRVGAYRAFYFAINLKRFGYIPYVLNLPAKSAGFTNLEKKLLSRVNTVDVISPFDKTNKQKSETAKNENHFSTSISNWIDKNTPADTWIYLFIARYFTILNKVRSVNPDIIWATGDPWSSLWLGKKIAQNLNKPLVCDFRDPWTLSKVSLRERSGFSRYFDKKMEKKIVQAADKITFTSKAAESSYGRHYNLKSTKTTTIYNSFSSDFTAEKMTVGSIDFNQFYLNLIFFGRFRRLSPAAPLVLILKQAKAMNSGAVENIRIHSFGDTDNKSIQEISDAGLEHIFIQHQPVLPEEKFSVLDQADFLLLSTHPDRNQIIPAKLWDYLAVNKPVFSISSNSEVEKIIDECSAGVHFYPSETGKAARLLINLVINKQKESVEKIKSDFQNGLERKKFEAKYTTEELAAIFDELTDNG